jgi:acetyl-CoA acyltransferase
MTVDDVLNARALAFPLTVPMCSPLTDGAAAAIVCSERAVRSLSRYRAIRVLASCVGSGVQRDIADYAQHISRLTAERAYAEAGIAPADVDVAEVHDATAFGEVLMTEMLELCELGGGGPAAEKGETTLGGRIPVNPSGGLESKGHPLAATGLGQVYELVQQLRGEVGVRQVEGAMIGIAENGGGYYQGEEAVAAVTILGR